MGVAYAGLCCVVIVAVVGSGNVLRYAISVFVEHPSGQDGQADNTVIVEAGAQHGSVGTLRIVFVVLRIHCGIGGHAVSVGHSAELMLARDN